MWFAERLKVQSTTLSACGFETVGCHLLRFIFQFHKLNVAVFHRLAEQLYILLGALLRKALTKTSFLTSS